ncbi:MAG TPA: CDP-6-deoxy-delta-3,4-glucoseen reductase, partial [Rhodocyclaceae bacterium]|nr:CDP-6-deoxy-delta-3,4-glucoseen reductase [Rhodocyclaceae bacterium]
MSFEITLQPSGRQYIADADTTLLQAALDATLIIPYGCRDGACGSCKATILSGEIDHGKAPESTLPVSEREAGMALLCCAKARSNLAIEVRDVRSASDIPLRKLPCRVQSLNKPASDVAVLNIKLPANDTFRFIAGQYIDFLLADGKRRSFSIANPPHQAEALELHIRHVPGGHFTEHVFSAMKERDILRFEGPLGGFYLRQSDKPIIFLAGGTGFAPIKSIIEDIAHQTAEQTNRRPMILYWGSRDRAGLYAHALAEQWARELPNFRYVPVISDAIPADWQGRRGLAHQAIMQDLPDLSGYQVYACGAP